MNSKKPKFESTVKLGREQRNESGLHQSPALSQNLAMQNQAKRGRRTKVSAPFSKNFANLLKEKRCSHRQAAKIAGIAPSVISGWTAGATPNDPAALLKITEALNADFQFILTGISSAAISAQRIAEIFDVEEHAELTGMFMLEAKRLRVRK